MHTSIVITYIPAQTTESAADSSSLSLQLVQEEYPFKSPGSFDQWLEELGVELTAANVIQAYEEYKSACTVDGTLEVGLRVYLSDITTPYNLVASYGVLSDGQLVEDTTTERMEMDLAQEQQLSFGTVTAAEFEGEVRDQDGEVIAAPALTIDGRQVSTPTAVDGTLAITSQVSYWRHTLTITPRDVSEEQQASEDFSITDLYAATVKVYAGGQKDTAEIAMPDDWGTCEGGYAVGGGIGLPDDEEPGEYEVVFEAFDYCTGDPIPGAEFTVDGTAVDPDGAVLEGGTHGIIVTADGYTSSSEDDLEENDTFTLDGQ